MMKKVTKGLLLINCLFILLGGCKDKKNPPEVIEEKFPSSISLTGTSISAIESLQPGKLELVDTLLIVANERGTLFFDIYNTNNYELVTNYGTEGRGPAEFGAPRLTLQKIHKEGRTSNIVFDWKQQTVTMIDFDSIIRDKKILPPRIKFPGDKINQTYKLLYLSDSLRITLPAGTLDFPGRFKILKNGEVKVVDFLPELPFDVKEKNLPVIYTTMGSAVHPERNKLVTSALFLGQYDFFNLSGEYLYSTVIDRDENLKNAASSTSIFQEPSTIYFSEIRAYDDLIYSLCTTSPTPAAQSVNNSRIHVMDWEGHLIKEYIMDQPLKSFVYDKENQAFYGLAFTAEINPVFKYKIPDDK